MFKSMVFRKKVSRSQPSSRKLRLETLEARALLSVTPLDTSSLYGPPSFEVWLDSQSQEVASSDANELNALIASLNAVSIETLETATEIPVELDGEEETASTDAVVRRVVFEEYATGLESDADVVIVPQLSDGELNATTYGARSGGSADWPLELSTSLTSSLSGDGNLLCEHRDAADVSGGSSSIAALLNGADYLTVAFPELPFGYSADVTLSGTATRGSDYRVFYLYGTTYAELLGTEFTYSGSGGATTFYIVPVNNFALENEESVTVTLETPTTPASGGSDDVYNFTGDASARTATATIVDDDLEFVSDSDRAADGSLPTLDSNPIPKNVDHYNAYIFADPEATSLAEDQLQFITSVSALAKSTTTLGAIQYSIVSGNDAGYFAINSATGAVSLTPAYYAQDVDDVIENATLQIKAKYANSLFDVDEATIVVNRLNFDIKPYTPETTYIAPMEIPEANWKANGVGIRRNADFDAGSINPDFMVSAPFSAENDLIKTNVVFETAYGIRYEIVRGGDALKFWKSSTKANGEYVFTNNALVLTQPGNVWAEYASSGDASYSLTLKATNIYTGSTLFAETATFRPFNSVTCAFVGEFETPGNTYESPGINNWVIERLKDGYDVQVWDDGYDIGGTIVDCNSNGEGRAANEIINAVNNRGVEQVAIVGYSHGGGSVYNLAEYLYNDSQAESSSITSNYSLAFTAYVDAVRNGTSASFIAETRRPLGSVFHTNIFQENNWPGGDYMDAADDNRDFSYLNVVHSSAADNESIDANLTVQNFLTSRYETKITR